MHQITNPYKAKYLSQAKDIIKKASQYHTASTTYPCFLPDLGESAGASRIDLHCKGTHDF